MVRQVSLGRSGIGMDGWVVRQVSLDADGVVHGLGEPTGRSGSHG